jgi:precorrin-6B methylase 1
MMSIQHAVRDTFSSMDLEDYYTTSILPITGDGGYLVIVRDTRSPKTMTIHIHHHTGTRWNPEEEDQSWYTGSILENNGMKNDFATILLENLLYELENRDDSTISSEPCEPESSQDVDE